MDELLKDMKVAKLQIDGLPYRVGYIHCPYKYRNDVDGFVTQNNVHDVDAVGMIMTDKEVVSYRRVNEEIDIYMSQVGKNTLVEKDMVEQQHIHKVVRNLRKCIKVYVIV